VPESAIGSTSAGGAVGKDSSDRIEIEEATAPGTQHGDAAGVGLSP